MSIGTMMMTKLLKAFGLLVVTAAVTCMAPAQAQTTVRYLHTDALGTVVAKTDANGNVIERTTFEPYGAVVGGAVADGPGYTGHVSDAATGLSYMQQRYYDPEVGLFLSVDPVVAYSEPIVQFNRYRYANGNPYWYVDPDGRQAAWRCSGSACNAMNRVISGMKTADKIESNIMQPASGLAGKMDLKLEGQVAAGMGIEASLSLIDGAGDVSVVMAGQGAAISLTLQPREGASMALPGNGGDAPTSLVVEGGAGRIAFAAAEVEANPGGTVEVTPKIGVGAGQYMKTTPAMKVFEWGGASKGNDN